MNLFSDSFLLVLSASFLLLVGVSRGEAPTIVLAEDGDDDLFGADDDGGTATATSDGVPEIRTNSALNYLGDCRRAGFDPMQLACTTCSILPAEPLYLRDTCEACCQSYRSLEKRTKRYEQAILINTGFPESVRELVRDDADQIRDRKGGDRFHIHDMTAEVEMMARMGMFQEQPTVVLWFNTPVNIDSEVNANELADQADDITVLTSRGLGRDDVREMLLTLLPDKETK